MPELFQLFPIYLNPNIYILILMSTKIIPGGEFSGTQPETNKGLTILAIESSCDETSASVCVNGQILSNFIAGQSVHEKYGGVVPELASRAHVQNIIPVVDTALKTANVKLSSVNAIAFTQSPGLIGSLLVGSQFAKSLALSLNIPLIAVHHMQAHVLANLIEEPRPSFPFYVLPLAADIPRLFYVNHPLI